MLENLVSNAIKYTPPGGRVTVNITPGKGTVSIEVHDTGIGIPEGEQLRLFEEFFRASNARRLEETGTGLGLSIVKQTVERHGGRIRVQSKEGQGTTFIVDLPLTQPVG
jgi:signal transduction histidine kinase